MPGFDRTGPVENGPMTGGARGLCGSTGIQRRFATEERGSRGKVGCRRGFRGCGSGAAFGRGLGGSVFSKADGQLDDEKESLEAQVRELQQSLLKMQQRVDEL